MRVNVPGQFRSAITGVNVQDLYTFTSASIPTTVAEYTPGAKLIDTTLTNLGGPKQNQNWSIESVTIQAYLGIYTEGELNPSGKFGEIFAGLITNSQGAQTQGGANPWVQPFDTLPLDNALISSLWNPDEDAIPPTFPYTFIEAQSGLQISTTLIPTFPIDIVSGVPPLVGIWLKPSVYAINAYAETFDNVFGLIIGGATYSINYDDGLG